MKRIPSIVLALALVALPARGTGATSLTTQVTQQAPPAAWATTHAAMTGGEELLRATAGRVQTRSLAGEALGSLPLGLVTYLGDSGAIDGNALAIDGQGDTFVTGTSTAGGAFVASYDALGRLRWTTHLRAAAGHGIAVDGEGTIYVTGETSSDAFPVTPGAAQPTLRGRSNAFVAAYTSQGTLRWATYLGGSHNDAGDSIAVDGQGNLYVTGTANSNDFPVSSGAAQSTLSGASSAFVASYTTDGTFRWATYLDGSGSSDGRGIAADGQGTIYVTGSTSSSDFPVTSGAAQSSYGGGSNNAFVASYDSGGTFRWATYLGGSGGDIGRGIAVEGQGTIYVTGDTSSSNFPVTPGATQPTLHGYQNAFVASYDRRGNLLWATYLGGSHFDFGNSITIDGQGNLYVAGDTQSRNFPVTPDAAQPTLRGTTNVFVASYTRDGTFRWATYLGGSGVDYANGIAVDAHGSIYVAGQTSSGDFPVTPGAAQPHTSGVTTGFLAHLIVPTKHPATLDPTSPLRTGTPHARYFPETHHTLRDPALRFWDNLAGTPTLGLPLSEPFVLAGQRIQVTERAVLIFSGTQVHLAPLGRILAVARPTAPVRPAANTANRLYFARTGHTLTGAFLRYWQTHQGSQLLGAPITEPDRETIGARVYLVQWFENGRLESHPESTDPRYRVQLGRVGFEFLYRLGLVTG